MTDLRWCDLRAGDVWSCCVGSSSQSRSHVTRPGQSPAPSSAVGTRLRAGLDSSHLSDPSILSISVSGPAAESWQVHSDQDGGKPGCSAHLRSEHRAPGSVLHHEHGGVLCIQPLQTWWENKAINKCLPCKSVSCERWSLLLNVKV